MAADSPGKPSLVRGFTFHDRDDKEQIAKLALSGMQLHGWADLDVKDINVKEVSLSGGARVFKVSTEKAKPSAVALKSHAESQQTDIASKRIEEASMVFSNAGLGPRRLAFGGDWHIEAWGGTIIANLFDEVDRTMYAELGRLLARIHQMPTDWYEPIRKMLCERIPAQAILAEIPHGSHAWNGFALGLDNGMTFFGGVMDDEKARIGKDVFNYFVESGAFKAWIKADFFHPASELGKRVVTVHGDYKPNNVVKTEEGKVTAIDFDFTYVGLAAMDLAFCCHLWFTACGSSYAERFEFFEAYTKTCGLSGDEKEVRELMLDAEICKLGDWIGPFAFCGRDWTGPSAFAKENHPLMFRGSDTMPSGMEWLQLCADFVKTVRADTALRDEVIDKGLLNCIRSHDDWKINQFYDWENTVTVDVIKKKSEE